MEGVELKPRRCITSAALFAAALLIAPSAGAQGSDADRYFREGQDLMAQQKYADACKRFESSLKLDAQLGTQLNLAFCYEKLGATWYAWLEYKEAEVRALAQARKDRADFARQRQAELGKNLAKVVMKVNTPAPDVVIVEDRTIPDAHKGVVFAAEPGVRKFTFKRAGKKPVEREVTIAKQPSPFVVETPTAYEDEPVAPTPRPDKPDKPDKPDPPPPPPAEGTSPIKYAAFGAIGLGVVGVGIGAATGIIVLEKETDARAGLDPKTSDCFADAKGDACRSAHGLATVATVGFIAGGAVLAGGVVMLLLAPSGKQAGVTPWISTTAHGGAAGLRGSF
jgi:hypothetical protein